MGVFNGPMTTYSRQPVAAPVVSGAALKAFVGALETPGLGAALLGKIMRDSGLDAFRAADPGDASPVQVPLEPLGSEPRPPEANGLQLAAQAVRTLPGVETVAAFRDAYASGASDPTQVIRRLHAHLERLESGPKPLALFIHRTPDEVLQQADESAQRLRDGRARSVLEGVPVVVKDELDVQGHPTTLGTSWRSTVAARDATVVARLRAAGAVILGKANMHEIGINPIGINPHHGACRNPFDPSRITGGSSSGSAAAVAAGVAPISLGADGGGSVRIPAALCGVVGLKATWGRLSEGGVPPLAWTPGHVGPIGATVADVAALYAVVAGRDERDPASWRQPPVRLDDVFRGDLHGIRLGVCWPFFEDAEPDVVANAKRAVHVMVAAGATVVEVPPPDLNVVLWSHSAIILTEMCAAMAAETANGGIKRFGLDARTNLAIGQQFKGTDVVHALRHRHALTKDLLKQYASVDLMVSPTTACVAPPMPEHALPLGESNLPVVDALMRFIRVGNLTGFPALSVPSGHDSRGLPTGVHLMARPYEEHLTLRAGFVVEQATERRLPMVHVRALA